jgi:hypothetical protein
MAFLKGLDAVLRNLNKEIKAIEGRSVKGLGLAVMEIRKDIDTTPPLVPVGETGNLRASWFSEPLNLPIGPAVIFGHSANYAVYVHEMLGAHFQRPGAGPKWLQAAIRNSKERTLRIIAENAKIPD